MTRINVVPVEVLTDKHLLAEYKEITRPFNKVRKRVDAGTIKNVSIPLAYCLGTGHETFFFNKLGYLLDRYELLFNALVSRGFNVDKLKFMNIYNDFTEFLIDNSNFLGNYIPPPEAMYLNMARLARRSNIESVHNELISDN